VAELTQWAEIHRWGADRKLALTQWSVSLLVLAYNEREDDMVLEDVARTLGEISARARLRSTATAERHVMPAAIQGVRRIAHAGAEPPAHLGRAVQQLVWLHLCGEHRPCSAPQHRPLAC